MKCPACQHAVAESDNFCRNCGVALMPGATAAPGAPPPRGSATLADLASEYAAALADAPEDAAACYNLALALLYQGNYSEAAANLAAVVEQEPEFADAYEKLAIALQKLGDTAGAITALEKALELEPDNVPLCAALERLRGS